MYLYIIFNKCIVGLLILLNKLQWEIKHKLCFIFFAFVIALVLIHCEQIKPVLIKHSNLLLLYIFHSLPYLFYSYSYALQS